MQNKPLFVAVITCFLLSVMSFAMAARRNNSEAGLNLMALQNFWKELSKSGELVHFSKNDCYKTKLIAKAKPDECYLGIGEPNLYPFDFEQQICEAGIPKTNESYVFGLTQSENNLWFGTAPNMGCLVYGAIAEQGVPTGLMPFATDLWVCEYGDGLFGQAHDLKASLGDWRPPSIYIYNSEEQTLEKKIINDPLIWETFGIRSAGTYGNVIFLAGPSVTGVGGPVETAGINMFAFRANDGSYLGSQQFIQYNNIRKWIEVDGVLYAGVLVNKEEFPNPGTIAAGAILRWTGDELNPFDFEIVGWVDGDAVELAEHDRRLFVSTWPDFFRLYDETYDYAGLWMSPPIGADGLHSRDAGNWQKVWSADDYERDDVTARMYNGGALASFDGYLYWGTTHAPLSAGFAHVEIYDLLNPDNPDRIKDMLLAVLGSHRPISIFRGRLFGSPLVEMEVVYGLANMPAYVENSESHSPERVWRILPNKMGPPLFGPAGFGNFYNTYTWTMSVADDRLFVGTMDWSHMFSAVMLPYLLKDSDLNIDLPAADYGADLFMFGKGSVPAKKISQDGVGNFASYGIRTMLADGKVLYLGMANSLNLMTDPLDGLPEGGWELILMKTEIP